MVQQKLHSKSNLDQLLNRNPPLQDHLSRNHVDEVMLNVINHTPQQLEEVLPRRTTKSKSLHEISTVAVDYLQTCYAFLG